MSRLGLEDFGRDSSSKNMLGTFEFLYVGFLLNLVIPRLKVNVSTTNTLYLVSPRDRAYLQFAMNCRVI